jgi:hypothetical protein
MLVCSRRLLLLGVLLMLCGCGGKSRPQLATVRGKVALKGQPVALAKITFIPVEGGQSSEGETSPSGEYELYFRYDEPGAQVGKHRVTISTFAPPEVDDAGKPYNANTTLEKEVVAGENVIDFDLN